MDVLLDVLDTFVLDRVYAAVLPVHGQAFKPSATLNENVGRYFELVPSEWALRSRWPREFIGRQFVSFFAITWYVQRNLPNWRREGDAGVDKSC